jgi:hypothetical protein
VPLVRLAREEALVQARLGHFPKAQEILGRYER